MTKGLKMLGGGGLAAVLGVVLLGFSALSASTASAESPPNPPSRTVGTVLVNGAPPASGTLVEARIGTTTCGVDATENVGGQQWYRIDVPALDPGATPNCGTDGAVVTFFVAGVQANETGSWHNYQLNTVNLTVTTQVPGATTTPTGTATVTATPRPPVVGNTTGTGSEGTAMWLFVALGLGALAFGATGVTVARRSR